MKIRFYVLNRDYEDFKNFVSQEKIKVINHFTINTNQIINHYIDCEIDGRKKKAYKREFRILEA